MKKEKNDKPVYCCKPMMKNIINNVIFIHHEKHYSINTERLLMDITYCPWCGKQLN